MPPSADNIRHYTHIVTAYHAKIHTTVVKNKKRLKKAVGDVASKNARALQEKIRSKKTNAR